MNTWGLECALCFRGPLERLPVLVLTILTPTVCVLRVSEQWEALSHPVHGIPPCLAEVLSVPETTCCSDVTVRGISTQVFALPVIREEA